MKTNFTQFGENKLFGRKDWDREFFERYARLYRPAAICCWSPTSQARRAKIFIFPKYSIYDLKKPARLDTGDVMAIRHQT